MGVAATLPELSEWTSSFDPTHFEMSKVYQGNFQSLCCLAELFLDTAAVILQKKSEIIGENFFPALKMQFGRFY